ncbi:MAG: MFS transporter [Polyangiales bacterium]
MPLSRARRRVATVAVLFGLIVAAFETTVVTTAMPTIAKELGGLALYPWVFSAFLVASMLGVLVCGKLADAYGRRPVYAGGMVLFLVGSILCGSANTLGALVAWRVVQGLGAGAIQPIAMTIVSDIYDLDERARIQGIFTSAWGAASVLGPVIGGWLVTHLSWRWVFLVNVPIGIVGVIVLLASYRDRPRSDAAVGARGALLGGVAAGLLLLAMEPLGGAFALRAALLGLSVFVMAVFVRDQRTSAAPIVAPELLPDPLVRASIVAAIFSGALLYTCAAYVPLWVTTHGGGTPLLAGLALVPLLGGWAIGSSFGVRIMVRHGMRASVVGGFAVAAIGAILLAVAHALSSATFAAGALAILGLGLGPAASTSLVAPQNHVPWRQRGAITSAVYATRALGGSFAVAIVGMMPERALDSVAVIALLGLGALFTLAPAGLVRRVDDEPISFRA